MPTGRVVLDVGGIGCGQGGQRRGGQRGEKEVDGEVDKEVDSEVGEEVEKAHGCLLDARHSQHPPANMPVMRITQGHLHGALHAMRSWHTSRPFTSMPGTQKYAWISTAHTRLLWLVCILLHSALKSILYSVHIQILYELYAR